MTTQEIKEAEASMLNAWLETIPPRDRRFARDKVVELCGDPITKKHFYNWKYGYCRIPTNCKKAIEQVAGRAVFDWSPEFL